MAKNTTIRNRCDALARTLLRILQEDTCEYCGAVVYGRQSHPHHIRSRKWYNSRWDSRNLVLLCAVCHRKYHDGVIGKDWFKEKYPRCWEWIETLGAKETKTWHESDLLEVERLLKDRIKDLA